jgi:hypothetical protein
MPEREADHSSHLVLRLRMRGAILPFLQYVFMARCLIKRVIRLVCDVLKSMSSGL